MINLYVENYCQNCPYFEPVAEKGFIDNKPELHILVHCKDMNKCNDIHCQILEDEAKKVGDAEKK